MHKLLGPAVDILISKSTTIDTKNIYKLKWKAWKDFVKNFFSYSSITSFNS